RLREEPLEEEPVLHRVHGGDPQAVRDHAVGGAATSLAEDSPRASEAHRVPHDDEEPRETEPADDLQLVLDLGALLLAYAAPTLERTGVDLFAQEGDVVVTGRQRVERKGRPQPAQREVAGFGDTDALL